MTSTLGFNAMPTLIAIGYFIGQKILKMEIMIGCNGCNGFLFNNSCRIIEKHPNKSDNLSSNTQQEITAFMKSKQDFHDGI